MSADFDSQESLLRLSRSLEFDAFFLYILGQEFRRANPGTNLTICGRLTVDFRESQGYDHAGRFTVPVETSTGTTSTEQAAAEATGPMGGTFHLRVPRGLDGGEPRHILDTGTITIQIEFFPRP